MLFADDSLSTAPSIDVAALKDLLFAAIVAEVEDSTADTSCAPVPALTKPAAARFGRLR